MHIKKLFYIITGSFLLNSFLIAQSVDLKKEFSNTYKLYKEQKDKRKNEEYQKFNVDFLFN